MRLLIFTQYFPPEMGAPQARLYELGTRVQNMGHSVTVLTALPNYPTGRVFSGYRHRARLIETMNGIRVVRTCLYPSKSGKAIPRLLSCLSFGICSVLFGVWGLGKQDIVLIESPPLFLSIFGIVLSKITRGKAIMMVSDIWPDIIIRMGYASEKSLSTRVMFWLERFSYEHSYAVAVTNPGARQQIMERFPYLKNVTVISNGVDRKMFFPELRNDEIRKQFRGEPSTVLVGYCGLHGLAQGLEVVLGAADRLRDRINIRFVMIGDGPKKEELVRKAGEMKLSNLVFYPPRPKTEMPAILASLDLSLVPLLARFPGTMPSKIYEALASGTPPIVARGCEGEHLVLGNNAGRSYEPGDPDSLARAILELACNGAVLSKVRANCLELSKRFDRDIIAQLSEQILVAINEGKPLPEVIW